MVKADDLSEMAKLLLSDDYARAEAATALVETFTAEYARSPNNAIRALLRILNKFEVTKDKRVLMEFVACGKHRPRAKKQPFGCLKLLRLDGAAVGHWVAVVPRDNMFVTIDSASAGESVSATPPTQENAYWLWPRVLPAGGAKNSGSRQQLGAGASKKSHSSAPKQAAATGTSHKPASNEQQPAASAGQGKKAPASKAAPPKAPASKAAPPKTPASKATPPKAPASKAAPPKTPASKAAPPKAPASKAAPPKAPAPEVTPPKAPAPEVTPPKAPAPKVSPKTTPPPTSAPKTYAPDATPASPPPSTNKKSIFGPAGPGRTRANSSTIFSKLLGQGGFSNLSLRDCAIATAVLMMRSVVQVFTPAAKLKELTARDPADFLDDNARVARLALTSSSQEVVTAIRDRLEATRAGAGWTTVDGRRVGAYLCPAADVMPTLLLGAVRMGLLSQDRHDQLLGAKGANSALCLPLSEAPFGSPEYILVHPSSDVCRLDQAAKHVELGRGVKGVLEAAIYLNDGEVCDAANRHCAFVGKQRQASDVHDGICPASTNDAFGVINDDKVSRIVTWTDAVNGLPTRWRVPPTPTTEGVRSTPVAVLMLFRLVRLPAGQPPRPDLNPRSGPAAHAAVEELPIAEIQRARLSVDEAYQRFQLHSSNSSPLAVLLKGKDLKLIRLYDKPTHASIAWKGKSFRVREGHLRTLRALQRLPEELGELPLGEALVHFYARTALAPPSGQPWLPATLHRNMCTAHGALADLPLYSDMPLPIHLRESASWHAAMRYTEQRMQETSPTNLPAITYPQVMEIVQRCTDEEVAAAIMITWMTAGRVGDVTQFKREEITFIPSPPPSTRGPT